MRIVGGRGCGGPLSLPLGSPQVKKTLKGPEPDYARKKENNMCRIRRYE